MDLKIFHIFLLFESRYRTLIEIILNCDTMNNSKKIKTYHYHEEWEHDYFFIMIKNKCCCLICNNSISLPKKGNLERHFKTCIVSMRLIIIMIIII